MGVQVPPRAQFRGCAPAYGETSRVTQVERRRVIAFIPKFIASAAFWSLYQQQFTVLTIYSDNLLDRDIFGWTMPVSWVQSINPVFIIILSGVFAALWTTLGDRQPSTPLKVAAGTIVIIAELLLSPVGLSLATKLAPEAFRTQMVALFFLSVALGTALFGTLATYYSVATQVRYLGILGGVAIVLGVILGAMTPWLKRLMGGIRQPAGRGARVARPAETLSSCPSSPRSRALGRPSRLGR